MSNRDLARRAKCEIAFEGVDITKSIRPYLLSLTYTDNEADETDDLQIKLQDRDDIWLTKWLNDIVEAAASSGTLTNGKTQSDTTTTTTATVSTSTTKVEKAVSWALAIAADNSHGYDQANRWGPNYDCSALVITAYQQAGIGVKSAGAYYTGNMRAPFLKCGFTDVTSKVNRATGSGMQRGDVLLTPGSHTAMYIGGGQIVHASINEKGKITGGKSGDQTGKEICTRSYYNKPWTYVLRYTSKDTASAQEVVATTTKVESAKTAVDANGTTGIKIDAVIVRENWTGGGEDQVLDCGRFELDSIDASGPPATVTIKATSLPYAAQIRQTKKTKAWESYTLSGIANEMASVSGLTCLYESENDPYYERVEQWDTSDIDFLSTLCKQAGISLKATNNILVLFDQSAYEAKDSVRTIRKGDGSYIKYKLNIGTADTEYQSCRVSYVDPATGKKIEGIAYVEGYDSDSEKNQQLEVSARVSNGTEAKTLAEKNLRLHNKYERTVTLTFPGEPGLVAGVNITLEKWGAWSGKYMITQAKHSVGSSGYTTEVKGRRVLEGY